MCSSCLITTLPVGCAFSSSSSSKPFLYPGFMVGDFSIDFVEIKPRRETKDGICQDNLEGQEYSDRSPNESSM